MRSTAAASTGADADVPSSVPRKNSPGAPCPADPLLRVRYPGTPASSATSGTRRCVPLIAAPADVCQAGRVLSTLWPPPPPATPHAQPKPAASFHTCSVAGERAPVVKRVPPTAVTPSDDAGQLTLLYPGSPYRGNSAAHTLPGGPIDPWSPAETKMLTPLAASDVRMVSA